MAHSKSRASDTFSDEIGCLQDGSRDSPASDPAAHRDVRHQDDGGHPGCMKGLPGGIIRSMLKAELDEQMEEREEAESVYHASRNGCAPKTLRSSMGEIPASKQAKRASALYQS